MLFCRRKENTQQTVDTTQSYWKIRKSILRPQYETRFQYQIFKMNIWKHKIWCDIIMSTDSTSPRSPIPNTLGPSMSNISSDALFDIILFSREVKSSLLCHMTQFHHTMHSFGYRGMHFKRVRHGDARDAVISQTMKNWPIFGQKFWTIGQIMQHHSHISEVVSIFPTKTKWWPNQRQNNGENGKIIQDYFAVLFCPRCQNRHCFWMNWNRLVIPTAFIKFRPTKKIHSSFG